MFSVNIDVLFMCNELLFMQISSNLIALKLEIISQE